MSIAATGITAATSRFGAAASALVRATTADAPSDSAQPVVDMIEARAGFRASLAVFRAADRNFKSLLDILA